MYIILIIRHRSISCNILNLRNLQIDFALGGRSITNMTNVVSVDETRKNLSEIISRAQYGSECFLVRKNNKDAVVIVNAEDFKKGIVIPELKELPEEEITPELRKLVEETRKMPRSHFINI